MKTLIYLLIAATLVIGTAPAAFAQSKAKSELPKAEKKAQKKAEKERKKQEKANKKKSKSKSSSSSNSKAPKGKKATAALTDLLQNDNDSLRAVIAKMEANISFNSSLGEGSSFTITIPNQQD